MVTINLLFLNNIFNYGVGNSGYDFFISKREHCYFEIYLLIFYKFIFVAMKIPFLIQSKLPCILQMKKVVV